MMRELEDSCRFDDLMNSEHSTDRRSTDSGTVSRTTNE